MSLISLVTNACKLCQLHSKSRLALLHPDLQGNVCKKQTKMKMDHDHGTRKRVVQCDTEIAATYKPPTEVSEVPTTLPTLERSVSRDRSSNERVSRSSNECVSVNDENIVNNHIDEITHIAETPCEITPVR